LKYWLLTTEYPPFHGGGISTYCYFTVRMFAAHGDQVHVFVPDDSVKDFQVAVEQPGVTVIRFNSHRDKLAGILGYTARLSYAFANIVSTLIGQKGAPDVIEAQDYLGIAYYLTQFKHLGYDHLKNTPIVITLHSPAFLYLETNRAPTFRFPDFWTCEMEKQSIAAADLLLSPSRWLADEITKTIDLGEKRIEVLANPYEPGPPPGNRSNVPNKIVYYGKLSPQKGTFELLTYFRELWESGFKYPLHLVGGMDIVFQPELKTMGQIIRNKYDAYIRKGLLILQGKIKPSRIREQLSDAHVLIFPSIIDNLPYAAMEAMDLGKVVLVSKQGGQREMVEDGIDGFLFDHEDPLSFPNRLKEILALPQATIENIGENAFRSVQRKYSPDMIYPRKRAILQKVMEPRRQGHLFPFLHQEKNSMVISPASGNLLSVVIPYYNMGAYLEECIGSIRQSTFKELEIIIVNDGSTDPASTGLLDKLEADVRQVRVIHQPNMGIAYARNNGAAVAGGAYLAFLDADDKIAPLYYERAIRTLQKNENVYFVGCWVQYFENSRAVWPAFTPQPPYALVHNPINSSGLVYKRNAFLAAGLNDPKVGYGLEDYESVIAMLEQGLNGVVLPECLFYYRVRTGSMIRSITREKLLYSNKYITEKHSSYYAKFTTQIINLLNANGPGYLFDNPSIAVRVAVTPDKDTRLTSRLKDLARRNEKLKQILLTFKKRKQ
jgi:glycosyltransferase involved in cell wall biosynthesis